MRVTHSLTRQRRAPRLRESCRAVRAALFATSAFAALVTAAPATAGTCVLAASRIDCSGVFATPAPDAALEFTGDDLTLVFGADAPSSVVATGVDGIALFAPGGSATLANYGDVSSIGSDVRAIDVEAWGDIAFDNEGDISASLGSGDSAPYDVTAVALYSYAGSVFASNGADASITADAEADYGYTFVRAVAIQGQNAYFHNAGDIEVDASVVLGNLVAVGVQETGFGFSSLYNEVDASIHVVSGSGQGVTYGPDSFAIGAIVTGTSAYVSNAGEILVDSAVHAGEGIATAIGVEAYGVYGFATTTNYGDIAAHGVSESADASYSFAYAVINKGFYLQGVASATNYGSIDAHAETYFGGAIAYGVQNSALYSGTVNGEGASISAAAEVAYAGLAIATAVDTYGKYYAHDTNAGTITAYAYSNYTVHDGRFTSSSAGATGVNEDSRYFGGAVLANSGTISATAITRNIDDFWGGLTGAIGVNQYGKYYTGVDNSGHISGYASANLGVASAYGVIQHSKYGAYTVVENAEGASIVAEAHTGSAAGDYSGGVAVADAVRMFSGSFALLYNDGLIAASASVEANDRNYLDYHAGKAIAYGSYQRGEYGATLRNNGDILAQAEADYGYATAYGAWMRGFYYAASYNEGNIQAVAIAEHGDAFAVGNMLDAPGQAFYQYCLPYGGGCVYTYYGGLAALENDGAIHAHAQADAGIAAAYGAVVMGALHAQAANRGDILAVASAPGGSAQAVGLLLRSDQGDAWVDNGEGASIVAAAYGDDASATALLLAAAGQVAVDNAGEIRALGDGERIAIDVRQTAGAAIANSGLIVGSILGSDADDELVNAAGGVLRLADASIELGYHDVYGNRFYNYGMLSVDGESLVDMGGGAGGSLVPSANPYAFYNGGAIDFQDGDADDSLLIIGDFAGDGDINVDVSGLAGTADTLYIDGSVVPGTAATVNVDLLDLSEAIEGLVPIVFVSGNSTAADFSLGEVTWNAADSFVSLDFSLVADIDASNATADAFALGIEVTGLSDPGTLAASLPGAVQGLVNSQVGTWRQRMGVIDAFHDGGIALWARIWRDKGGFSPGHHAGFGDAGNFDWSQKNSGAEAGIDFAVTDEFSLGLLVGKSQADTHLKGAGAGSTGVDADTWGLYGTWISPGGFYLDASWRWLDFDADLDSAAGAMATDGKADSFNLEMGYAWTLSGGLKLEPQFQYTRTRVDDIGTLVAAGGMRFASDSGESSRGRVGLALRKSFGDAASAWSWTPYGTVSAVREFDGESRYAINDGFHGETELKGTSTLLELGVAARHQGWTLDAGLNWQDGGAMENFLGGQLEVRYSFGAGR
jgi:outer membrane autotransporter protein